MNDLILEWETLSIFVSFFVHFCGIYTLEYRLYRCLHMYVKELVYGSRFDISFQ